MNVSKWTYYGRSIITLLTQFENPVQVLKIFSGALKEYPTTVAIKGRGLRFAVGSPMDVWVVKETCVDGDYFPDGLTVKPDWNVIDIGAALGDFTVLAAKQFEKGVVHAYEPFAESVALLEKNIALNQVANVTYFVEAVAAEAGQMSVSNDGSGGVEAVSIQFAADDAAGVTVVPAVSLETALSRLPNGRCDFLKLDCEGGEFDILLNSAAETVQKIDRISMEYHNGFTPHTHTEIKTRLESLGFRVHCTPNPVHDYLGFLYAEQ